MGGDEAGVRMASGGRVELLNKMQMHATPHYHLNSIMLFCDIFTEYILINSTGEPRNEHDRTRRQLSQVWLQACFKLQVVLHSYILPPLSSHVHLTGAQLTGDNSKIGPIIRIRGRITQHVQISPTSPLKYQWWRRRRDHESKSPAALSVSLDRSSICTILTWVYQRAHREI